MRKHIVAGASVLFIGLTFGSTAHAQNGEAAAQALGCTACHAAETKLVGPAYVDVAKRYGGDTDKILERIKAAVNNGASGNWTDVTGGTPMPPQPQASGKEKELKQIAEWIAGMAK
ncbi:c-type cytochrome [Thiohalorhabdus sp. Cl-TMA]|uniref:Cytochrome c-551 n=1 Tax=Thiohalorhabdus methylotrophus TaxID=3242694 RepID=A0ABV4TVH6_9GAMM